VVPLFDDHTVLGGDFSSVETITNAIESHDWDRVQAVLDKRISHEGTAKLINDTFGLNLARHQGKAINHGFDKGESPFNLARTLFKTERPSRQQVLQVQAISKRMLDEYPKTAKFRDELWERARDNPLVVTNSFGRRLMCFSRAKYGDAGERFAKHDATKKYWCSCGECAPRRDRWKYAIAFLGRSAAFDALLRKMATIWYDKRLDQYSLPIIECHDELDFSVPMDKVDFYAKILKETFEEPIPELGGISLPASVAIGPSWAEAH
jgi:DNA polymerase I-like protein with 3'-5' exonuclease and polymerase domains